MPRGRPKKEETEVLHVRIPVELANALREEAERREWSLSHMALHYLKAAQQKGKK
jgi:hypothetical protein